MDQPVRGLGAIRQRLGATVRRLRARTRLWLWRHPRARARLARSGSLEINESALARGVAVGLLVGLTPTVGIQTPLLLGLALVFRANFPAAFITSWINNPLTVAPLYVGVFALGGYLESRLPVGFAALFAEGGRAVALQMTGLLLASLIIALPAAACGYLLSRWVWRRFKGRTG